MYEHITYDVLMRRMLDRVPIQMDKREGSMIYDALAPAAVELLQMYIELDVILKETFADTATKDFLARRTSERAIVPSPATHAIRKGVFNVEVPIGARFSCGQLNYVATERKAFGEYEMRCETAGQVGNTIFGPLVPINYISGLTEATLSDVLILGEDEEDAEHLRARYFKSFDTQAYGGNVQDYINRTTALDGVGATKVTPIWAGGGTVLLTILDAGYNKATPELIEKVQEAIDPQSEGMGVGIAPIGHQVTVNTPDEVVINIQTNITFVEGFAFENVKAGIEAAMHGYFHEIRVQWLDQTSSVVRTVQVESRIMNVEGVEDIANTTINGVAANLTLGNYEIPVLGAVTHG